MIKIGILGAAGRMGKSNIELIVNHSPFTISSLCESLGYIKKCGNNSKHILDHTKLNDLAIHGSLQKLCEDSDVVVDFTSPSVTIGLLDIAIQTKTKLIIGTTGFDNDQIELITKAGGKIPIVLSGNFSKGINVLIGLTRKATSTLGKEYDIELIEKHHKNKVDAPSGTAKMLLESCQKGIIDREKNTNSYAVITGREGLTGKRNPKTIGVFAMRGGGVVGQHEIEFMGEHETVRLSHMAQDRKAFSSGVISAIEWISKQNKPEVYSMLDVLSLN